MGILGLIIFVLFMSAVIITAVERWKYQEFEINTDNDRIGKRAFGIGYLLSLLLAVLVASVMSGSADPRATYFINGIAVKGGTNWMIVVITFIFGGGVIGLLILLFSALPALLLRSMNKEYRENMQERRAAGTLQKVYRKKALAIFLAIISAGIGYWFYMKMWHIGCLYFLTLIVGSVFSRLGFPLVLTILFLFWFTLTILNLVTAIRKKEVTLKKCIIHLE